MLYVREARSDEGDVGIRAFRSAGTDRLVGAAGAGIALASEIRFGTGTVFYEIGLWLDQMEQAGCERPGSTWFWSNELWGGF